MINKTDNSADPAATKDCSADDTNKQRSDDRFYQVQPQRGAARLRVRYREGTTRDSSCRLCR